MKSEILVIILAITIVGLVGGGITAASIIEIPYTVQGTCSEDVPQTYQEKMCEGVPFEETYSCPKMASVAKEVPISYEIVEKRIATNSKGFWVPIYWYTPVVTISNTDDVGGTFKVTFNIEKSNGGKLTESREGYIKPKEKGFITAGPYQFSIKEWTVDVVPPNRKIVVNEQVTETCSRIVYKQQCKYVDKVKIKRIDKPCPKVEQRSIVDVFKNSI